MDTFAWKHKPSNMYFGIHQDTGRSILTRNADDVFFFSEENQGVAVLVRRLNDIGSNFADFDCMEINLP